MSDVDKYGDSPSGHCHCNILSTDQCTLVCIKPHSPIGIKWLSMYKGGYMKQIFLYVDLISQWQPVVDADLIFVTFFTCLTFVENKRQISGMGGCRFDICHLFHLSDRWRKQRQISGIGGSRQRSRRSYHRSPFLQTSQIISSQIKALSIVMSIIIMIIVFYLYIYVLL